MRFLIHNSFHAGDILLTRLLITALRENFPQDQLILECRDVNRYLWEDLELPIIHYTGSDHQSIEPTPNCPKDTLFINAWFGLYPDILTAFSLTYPNNVFSFNRQMAGYRLGDTYHLTVPSVPPALRFYNIPELPMSIRENAILVENGRPRSGQNNFPINHYLGILAEQHPELTFYCSAKPPNPRNLGNLVDCSHLNLIQLAELSDHCIALVTLGSGVNAATYTEVNRFKPRCLVGMTLPFFRIWDDTFNPPVHAQNIQAVSIFLNEVTAGKKRASLSGGTKGFDLKKMCKFLKSHQEIETCSLYLYENGCTSHNLPCKNWELAHIISDLEDGNLLDLGSTDSYILKNALLKKTSGQKYGIDLREPDLPLEGVIYLVGDLLTVPLADETFQFITCLSVIEHEVDVEQLAATVSRLLRPGGKFYLTFDYWVPKITTGLKLYDRQWQPLDDWDVSILIHLCEAHNLQLTEEIDWSLGEKVIHPGYYSPHPQIGYTFGMLVFKKVEPR